MTAGIKEWYDALSPTLQIFWTIASVTSLVFLIQTVLTFVGIGDTDTDVDFGCDTDFSDGNTLDIGGAMQLFTIRNLINFLLGFSWGGICLAAYIPDTALLYAAATATGILFVYVFLLMYRQLFRLEKDGTVHIEDCVGQVVDVYLTIPAMRKGKGKVQVSFYGSVLEITALADGENAIPSGTKVRVLEIVDRTTVLVERL
ncbi:MAG: serine protease [Bacteroidaceae bacterium]|nr:serine protease [Bacteroidaceae bacterium]